MPRVLPREVRIHVDKARESALLAVEVYNKPLTTFPSGGYITLMCIAWTALFHSICFRNKTNPFYRNRDHPRLYERVDGDYKAWDLAKSVKEFYGGGDSSIRKNLEFIVGLRNKIEHRSMPELDLHVFGECQALLFNLEDLLVRHFGRKYAFNESLSLALQFSQMRDPEQAAAVQSLHRPLAKNIDRYLRAFRSSLTTEQLNDLKYSYKVFLIPGTSNNRSADDLTVQFVRVEDMTEETGAALESAIAIIKPMTQQVANAGRLTAKQVCSRIQPIVQQVCRTETPGSPAACSITASTARRRA